MTAIEYQRWKNVALRFAHRGLGLRSKRSRRLVAEFVKDFFRTLEQDYLDPRWCSDGPNEGLLGRIRAWDGTDSHPTWRDQYGHQSIGPYICDIVSEREEGWNPDYWSRYDSVRRRWEELWMNRVRICLRAAIDLAQPDDAGGGVMGLTAGDIRRMYKGRVPEWITGGDAHWITQHFDGVVQGIGFVPGTQEENGTFDSMPDEAELWI